jgi:hypothetical protein
MDLETKERHASRGNRGHASAFTYADAEDSYNAMSYGSLLLRDRELKPADGYYAPKDHPDTFTADPIGAEFLEFWGSRFSNHEVCGACPTKWEKLTAAVVENREDWRKISSVPPSRLRTDEALADVRAK